MESKDNSANVSQMQIIGTLEQNVGQARMSFAAHADFPRKHFGDMSESEWLESPTTTTASTMYPEYVKARDRLELWEFLLNAARHWRPGDNVVDTWSDKAFAVPASDGNSPYPVQ